MKYWIKERHNPQLGSYFVPCGKLTSLEAKKKETTRYGDNYMTSYATKEEYDKAVQKLRDDGMRVHDA